MTILEFTSFSEPMRQKMLAADQRRNTPDNYRKTILTGCGRTKQKTACPAAEMYTGTLCKLRREYAEATLASNARDPLWRNSEWFIISAKHGLTEPDRIIEPYDLTISDLCPADRAAWTLSVAHAVIDRMEDDETCKHHFIEIHAGRDYAEALRNVFYSLGFCPLWFGEGMGIGEQQGAYRTCIDRITEVDRMYA